VKPANIMRTPRGRLYLIDFGIARHFRPEKARDTGSLGSPGYAAPEQYGRAQSTEQTDIYSLGVTLTTLLTGRDPLDAEPAVPPTQLPDKAMQELQRLLEVMQAADPAERLRTMREVKERLLFIRHHRTRLALLGHSALTFLIGLLIGSLPYLFVPLLQFISSLYPNGEVTGWLVLFVLPFYFLYKLWPLVLICQCLLAFYFLFLAHPRRHVLAIGILLMLVLIYLAIFFGWLPSAGSLFN
jgi:serine/threonine protein kinase